MHILDLQPKQTFITIPHTEMEDELNKKSPLLTPNNSNDSSQKRQKTDRDDGGGIFEWLTIDGEMVAELSKLLETETTESSQQVKVKFIDNPYSSLEIFQTSCSFITINGNEESCGSSFSDFGSSVMVSTDLGLWGSAKLFSDGNGDGDETDGLDWFGDFDDERLLRFVGKENFQTE